MVSRKHLNKMAEIKYYDKKIIQIIRDYDKKGIRINYKQAEQIMIERKNNTTLKKYLGGEKIVR